jgi:oxygen-independent coproporphyrinogen-3 oxidase
MNNLSSIKLAPHPFDNSLYIHIPFCRQKCRYCDFYSLAGCSAGIKGSVIDGICRELSWFRERLMIETVRTVYIGGGTPSVLPRKLLEKLISTVRKWCAKPLQEWTVEANPESLDHDFLAICSDNNVTRISLGLQSFSDRLLGVLGRPGSAADNHRALECMAKHWQGEVSFDLMTGIPGETGEDLRTDLEAVLAVCPGHVSVYALNLEEETEMYRLVKAGTLLLPGEEEAEELWQTAFERLCAAGYHQYEVSNFCLPGKECLHNLVYWNLHPYIGSGPGAVSTLAGEAGRVLRIENAHDLESYLRGDPLQNGSVQIIEPKEVLLEHLLMGLRLLRGISRELFEKRFGNSAGVMLGSLWKKWRRNGLVETAGEFDKCTPKGMRILNRLLREAAEKIDEIDLPVCNWP